MCSRGLCFSLIERGLSSILSRDSSVHADGLLRPTFVVCVESLLALSIITARIFFQAVFAMPRDRVVMYTANL